MTILPRRWLWRLCLAAVVILGAAGYLALFPYRSLTIQIASMAINYVRSFAAPAGVLSTEVAGEVAVVPAGAADASFDEWTSYNRTLTSERFSALKAIDRTTIAGLKIKCTYDTGEYGAFEPGLLVLDGKLIGTTGKDIFAIDPATCREIWRTREDFVTSSLMMISRGAAYLDGRLFRGTEDGRVLAYDVRTGGRLWATTIADPARGESVSAAPIAWNGLVFIGNAGGDNKGVKGRMYALEATTGRIVWEFYLVPKGAADVARGPLGASPLDLATWRNAPGTPVSGGATWTSYTLDPATGLLYVPGGNPAPDFAAGVREGENLYSGSMVVLDARTGAYVRHYKLVPKDWHDWDVSSAPTLVTTRAGRRILATAPKDGHLYGYDLASQARLYRSPVTRVENADATFATGTSVHFCPGSMGGAEWNGAAYDPTTNLVVTGEVDWCTAVTLATEAKLAATKPGNTWSGMDFRNPYHTFGEQDSHGQWAGWVYASDADTGMWKWRVKANFPVLGGLLPTAGGLTFFGDMGGNFYALDSASGRKLWGLKLNGAVGGGVITYRTGGVQRIAVAAGFTSILWPTEVTTGKVIVLGID